jgi:integrase/recombinase XerD
MLQTTFDLFLKEEQYLKNVSPNTLDYLGYCFKAFVKVLPDANVDRMTPDLLKRFVVGMKEKGMSTGTANAYIRGINSFLSWLHENGYTTEHLKIKHLKQEQRVMRTFTDEDIRKIITWKPKSFCDYRLHALLCTVADTGMRIDEAFTLERGNADLDNLLLIVRGKGNKERVVPISMELRKVLYRFLRKHTHSVVFPNLMGGRLLYDNTRRDFNKLCGGLGIGDFDGSFHAFRRKFARNYVKNGGNLFYLQKAMGHTKLETTRKYVDVATEDLQDMHYRTSLLARLR